MLSSSSDELSVREIVRYTLIVRGNAGILGKPFDYYFRPLSDRVDE